MTIHTFVANFHMINKVYENALEWDASQLIAIDHQSQNPVSQRILFRLEMNYTFILRVAQLLLALLGIFCLYRHCASLIKSQCSVFVVPQLAHSVTGGMQVH